jgi:uncharacterized membrane protein
MDAEWGKWLDRWVEASLVDRDTAEKIRAWEAGRIPPPGLRWPVLIALSLGGLMLAAGVILFVASGWDEISPGARFSLVRAMVAAFHLGGAAATGRFEPLAVTLHAIGTAALGAGIFLTAQIFNLEEHWPSGFLLWAIGAWIGWRLRRDWPQAALAALLTYFWLAGEWIVAMESRRWDARPLAAGLVLLALAFVSAVAPGSRSVMRWSLVWVGVAMTIPAAVAVVAAANQRVAASGDGVIVAATWALALALPVVLSWLLARRGGLVVLAYVPWAVLPSVFAQWKWTLAVDAWEALGALGLIVWGVRDSRPERINLGFAGFALSVLAFYFSNVMDRMGRSASLVGLGLLFLAGGWALEKSRRRILAGLGRGGV